MMKSEPWHFMKIGFSLLTPNLTNSNRRVSVLIHPIRAANMPSSRGLFCDIHAFEKQENMTFRYWFGPPVRWLNTYLFVLSHFSIEECLPRIGRILTPGRGRTALNAPLSTNPRYSLVNVSPNFCLSSLDMAYL